VAVEAGGQPVGVILVLGRKDVFPHEPDEGVVHLLAAGGQPKVQRVTNAAA
jgi:hypothetical protein